MSPNCPRALRGDSIDRNNVGQPNDRHEVLRNERIRLLGLVAHFRHVGRVLIVVHDVFNIDGQDAGLAERGRTECNGAERQLEINGS